MTDEQHNNIAKVFEILGVKPEEEFQIKESYNDDRYRIDKMLYVQNYDEAEQKWLYVPIHIHTFINGMFTIIKEQ